MTESVRTKAETLLYLAGRGFPVPPLVFFTADEWEKQSDACLAKISGVPSTAVTLAVRSSALIEDGGGASLAGAFHTVPDVPAHSESALREAVAAVLASLPGRDDQIIVQAMVENVSMSGVLMTRTLVDGSPYYVVNYDDVSGRNDTVTGGRGNSKTVFVYRGTESSDFDSRRLLAVIDLARELEHAFDGAPLDMEFAVDKRNTIHLLQARRIAAARNWTESATGSVESALNSRIEHVAGFVEQLMTPRHGLFGRRSILGVMPDWNPAEMIGIHPRPLASGLYRERITRETWRQARACMGYLPLPPTELMVMVAGSPYIDVRASFNSFLPAGVHGETGERLINAFLDHLDANPAFHDKVEFEIVPTVLTPNFESEFKSRYGDALSVAESAEYKVRLTDLTRSAFMGDSLDQALLLIEKLRNIQENMLPLERAEAENLRQFDLALHLTEALEQCRASGTLPFAVIARHAFIAETWLRAAVRTEVLTTERVETLKRSIETVSGKLTRDFNAVLAGTLSREDFLQIYGHLRPGAYDISSPSYRERPDLFSACPRRGDAPQNVPNFTFTAAEKEGLDALFASCGLTFSAASFLHYVRRAVAGREYGKFIFTRHLDHILHLVKIWGRHFDFSPDDLSMLPIEDIVSLGFTPLPTAGRAHFSEQVESRRREYKTGQYFKLAYLIRSPRDVYIVPHHRSRPNFIGRGAVEADVAVLTPADERLDMEGRLVCIENADPGYDWIFTRNIAGLITRYGGANSHMAIRCAEYGLPAAIGCGDKIFEEAVAWKRLYMDCASETIRPAEKALLGEIQ
jgi:hypothetical protein